jgi:2-polyprenyl-3-methyl-5-hydroxy-6-metoxy-1,4-benzoquinol methylase
MVLMQPVTQFARNIYHRLIPYDLRMRVWTMRRHLSFAPDHLPGRGASPTERIAIRFIGKRALRTSGFAQAVLRHTAGLDTHHAMLRTWIEYPLGTNQRGEEAVQVARQHIAVTGARSLDIGCAYGGTPIAFARAGADAYGLELDAGLLGLAQYNLADHPGLSCTLLTGDILQPEVAQSLGQFDIITCDNVIEHVEKASRLIETIARMLRPDGVCVMGIPNPCSYLEVLHDGHYALFGLTLLDREQAIAYFVDAGHADAYGVGEYTFTLDDYRAMFHQQGLSGTLLNAQAYSSGEVEALKARLPALRARFAALAQEGSIPVAARPAIERGLERYLAGFDARYAAYRAAPDRAAAAELGGRLLVDYQQDQWQVLSRHRR